MAQINYIADVNFHPFSFQERVAPYLMYKDAYEKREAELDELYKEANAFKYLENVLKDNPDDRAAVQYKNYMDQLNAVSDDFSKNGMSISNSRSLRDLRRRYNGEIGQLVETDKELKDLRKKRRDMQDVGKQMLYANENPTLSDLLPGGNFNGYAIDVEDIYKLGEETGKALSSREYKEGEMGKALNGQYQIWQEVQGMSPEQVDRFINSDTALRLADNYLAQKGVLQNLQGTNLVKARIAILNGMRNGIIYKKNVDLKDNKNFVSATEARRQAVNERMNGITWPSGIPGVGEPVYDKDKDLTLQRSLSAIQERAAARAAGASGSGSGRSSSDYGAINQEGVRISWKGNTPNDTNEDEDRKIEAAPLKKEDSYVGEPYEYDALPQYVKDKVNKIIGKKGNFDNYIYYFRPYESNIWNDTEAAIDIVPRRVIKDNSEEDTFDGLDFNFGAQ